jgi:hypothetical protein
MSKPGESPTLDDSAKSPIRLFRFAADIRDLIVDVVAPASPARDALKQGVDALSSDHWQVMTWSDLKVFTSGDVATALRPGTGVPSELSALVIVRKLGFVVDNPQFGTLTPAMTMDDIVSLVKHCATLPIIPGSPAH